MLDRNSTTVQSVLPMESIAVLLIALSRRNFLSQISMAALIASRQCCRYSSQRPYSWSGPWSSTVQSKVVKGEELSGFWGICEGGQFGVIGRLVSYGKSIALLMKSTRLPLFISFGGSYNLPIMVELQLPTCLPTRLQQKDVRSSMISTGR